MLSEDILTILARIEPIGARDMARGLEAGQPETRLRVIVDLIADTVLPRNLTFSAPPDMSCTLMVASGRLLRLSISTPDGHQVLSAGAGASREDQLALLCEALAGLAATDVPFALEKRPLAEEVAAEEVGHGAGEIRALMEEQNWFIPDPDRLTSDAGDDTSSSAAADPGAFARTRLSRQGERLDAVGAAGLQLTDDQAAALAEALDTLPAEAKALLSPEALVSFWGLNANSRGVAVAITSDDLRVDVTGRPDLLARMKEWLSGDGNREAGR